MQSLFQRTEFVIFTTREYAHAANVSLSSASHTLARYAKNKLITHLTKGLWANITHPYFTPLACVPYLLGKEQGYVSFLTALHLHGALSQIPNVFHVATTGHSRKLDTVIGRFEFIQIKPSLMRDGVQWSETTLPYLMADIEKALLDVLYISTRKNNRFSHLPEFEFDTFSEDKFQTLFDHLDVSSRIKNAMNIKYKSIIEPA